MSDGPWFDAFDALGARLAEAGVPRRDVVLPGASEPSPRMGALIVQLEAGGAELRSFDAGRSRVLGRFTSPQELVTAVEERVLAPLPEPMDWPESRVPEADAVMQDVATQVIQNLASRPGGRVSFPLTLGGIVDKFGTSNGFVLYPGGTPFAHRSLPPSEVDESLPDLGLVRYGIARADIPVVAEVIPPLFGQPGGGVLLELADLQQTIRDLLVSGALRRLRLI